MHNYVDRGSKNEKGKEQVYKERERERERERDIQIEWLKQEDKIKTNDNKAAKTNQKEERC